MNKLYILSFLFISFTTSAQHVSPTDLVTSEKSFSKLHILESHTIHLIAETVMIDTLIMDSKSRIKLSGNTFMVVQNAFIEDGVFDGSGQTGIDGATGTNGQPHGENGEDGQDGASLNLAINIQTLSKLTIDLSGGNGGNGGNGFSPDRGGDGGNAGAPGNGGDGGNLTLVYLSENFVPSINRNTKHTIQTVINGGNKGISGTPGKGGKGGSLVKMYDSVSKKYIYIPSGAKSGEKGKENFEKRQDGLDGSVKIKKIRTEDLAIK